LPDDEDLIGLYCDFRSPPVSHIAPRFRLNYNERDVEASEIRFAVINSLRQLLYSNIGREAFTEL
jgi:hypothetical protein